MDSSSNIGVFDSGVGGLSVLQALEYQLPHEQFVYLADSAYAPYGAKTAEKIIERAEICTRFLIEQQHAKLIVVACNTATAIAIHHLRNRFHIPFVGVEPAIKPAAKFTRNARIGVLATPRTIASERYASLLQRYTSNLHVVSQACPELAARIEKGRLNDPDLRELLTSYLQPLQQAEVDTIVLGCTHYPFVQNAIRQLTHPEMPILETGEPVAQQVKRVLQQRSQLAKHLHKPATRYFTSGYVHEVQAVMRGLLGAKMAVNFFEQF